MLSRQWRRRSPIWGWPKRFTNAVRDYAGTWHPAGFDYFEYHEREFSAVPSLYA
jgi:hypothetical protein